LRRLTGDDATATFESDANFVESNPGAEGSSENVEEQRDTDDVEDSDEEIEDEEELADEDDGVENAVAALRADGLLGQEDEQEDVAKKRDRAAGDKARAGDDDDAGDVDMGVDEDALDEDDMDTDKVAARSVSLAMVLNLMNAGVERRI
ncbi:MAG: hypothetical protein V4555_07965, partial [Acidobacteriota bacterium]